MSLELWNWIRARDSHDKPERKKTEAKFSQICWNRKKRPLNKNSSDKVKGPVSVSDFSKPGRIRRILEMEEEDEENELCSCSSNSKCHLTFTHESSIDRWKFLERIATDSPTQLAKLKVSRNRIRIETFTLPSIREIEPTGCYLVKYYDPATFCYWSVTVICNPNSVPSVVVCSRDNKLPCPETEEADKVLKATVTRKCSPCPLFRLLEITKLSSPLQKDILKCKSCTKSSPALQGHYYTPADKNLEQNPIRPENNFLISCSSSNTSIASVTGVPEKSDLGVLEQICNTEAQLYCACRPSISLYLISESASWLIRQLSSGKDFRRKFIQAFFPTESLPLSMSRNTNIVYILMTQHNKPHVDILGNRLVNSYVLVRCEMETALSWLSTLGGAFSALGDISENWATEAGIISGKQLKIAVKLDDPLIASRCRLYAAISLMQRGYVKKSREVVKKEYKYAKSLPDGQDPKLRRMCLGVWAKLQHFWKQTNTDTRKSIEKQNPRNNNDLTVPKK